MTRTKIQFTRSVEEWIANTAPRSLSQAQAVDLASSNIVRTPEQHLNPEAKDCSMDIDVGQTPKRQRQQSLGLSVTQIHSPDADTILELTQPSELLVKQSVQFRKIWQHCKAIFRIKKFWLELFWILSMLGMGMNITTQEKLADLAVHLTELLSTLDAERLPNLQENNEVRIVDGE